MWHTTPSVVVKRATCSFDGRLLPCPSPCCPSFRKISLVVVSWVVIDNTSPLCRITHNATMMGMFFVRLVRSVARWECQCYTHCSHIDSHFILAHLSPDPLLPLPCIDSELSWNPLRSARCINMSCWWRRSAAGTPVPTCMFIDEYQLFFSWHVTEVPSHTLMINNTTEAITHRVRHKRESFVVDNLQCHFPHLKPPIRLSPMPRILGTNLVCSPSLSSCQNTV